MGYMGTKTKGLFMENKAIILSRVSSNHQTLEQQTETVLKEVKKDGYTDDNIIIIEDKESAIKLSEEERNGLNKMKEYINNDPSINVVYLYELSRLSRRQTMLFNIRDYLIEKRIQLICLQPYMRLLDEDGKMSQTASLMFSIFSSFSETEMMLKKERMMRGRRHNKLIGKTMGGRPTFGYFTDREKYYRIDPQQSALLKRMYLEYIGGKPIFVIAKELKEEGLFPKCIVHTLSHKIDRWLQSEYLLGNSQYPQIISKSLFDKAQKERAKRKKAPRKSHTNIFLLKGMIYDGNTNHPIWGQRGIESYCDTHFGGVCIKRQYVDPIVWDFAKKMYQKYIMNKKIYRRQLQKDLDILGIKINNLREEKASITKKIDKVEERMIFGNLSTKRGEELIYSLKEKRNETEHRILELSNESITKNQQLIEIDMKEIFDEKAMTLDERIAIVKKVVRKVTVIRPSKYTAHISIFNRINDIVTVYEAKSHGRSNEKGVWKIDEYHLKEKSIQKTY